MKEIFSDVENLNRANHNQDHTVLTPHCRATKPVVKAGRIVLRVDNVSENRRSHSVDFSVMLLENNESTKLLNSTVDAEWPTCKRRTF